MTPVPPRGARHGYITSQETRWRAYVRQRLRSLTVALALVLGIGAIALGLAIGVVLSELRQRDQEDSRSSKLEQQVTRLEARIHRLERHSPAR